MDIKARPCKACGGVFKPTCGVHYFCSAKCTVRHGAVRDANGCLIGRFHLDRYGYGQVMLAGEGRKNTTAHKISYRENVGPIPDRMCVCHSCDNPACIEPLHLFLGTHGDNKADSVKKGRHARGSRVGMAKLTEPQAIAIFSDRRKLRVIAAEYGVSPYAIQDVRYGRVWGHVTGATRST